MSKGFLCPRGCLYPRASCFKVSCVRRGSVSERFHVPGVPCLSGFSVQGVLVSEGVLCLREGPMPQGVLHLRQFRHLRPVGCLPQEEMALGLISCPDYQPQLHQHSYLRSTVILLLSLLMVLLGSRGWAGEQLGQFPEPRPSCLHPRSAS